MKPSVNRAVHYMARGSADGKFPPVCRAATITEVGPETGEAHHLVGLCVINPTGLFFHSLADGGVRYDPGGLSDTPGAPDAPSYEGGTWHWPERVE